jgi:SAM-dependent methyltransferase
VAGAYAETFATLCRGTVPLLVGEIREGDRVLDVGCGTGELAVRARGAGASVTAVDDDPGMVALARDAIGDVVLRAALPNLPFVDGAFDVVIANFVVNHVADPRAATRELARLAAPGGRVLATVWPSGQTVQSRLMAEIVAAAGAVPPPSLTLPPELDFRRTAAGLAGLLAGAGLADVRVEEHTWMWRIRAEQLWAGVRAGIGGIGATYRRQPLEVQRRLDEAFVRLREPLLDGDELVLPSTALVGRGRLEA